MSFLLEEDGGKLLQEDSSAILLDESNGRYRSLLAFWIGGASSSTPSGDFRSLFAFWMGGASASLRTAAPPAGRPLARPPIRRFDPWYEHELAPVLLMFEDD